MHRNNPSVVLDVPCVSITFLLEIPSSGLKSSNTRTSIFGRATCMSCCHGKGPTYPHAGGGHYEWYKFLWCNVTWWYLLPASHTRVSSRWWFQSLSTHILSQRTPYRGYLSSPLYFPVMCISLVLTPRLTNNSANFISLCQRWIIQISALSYLDIMVLVYHGFNTKRIIRVILWI